ncbi:MAG: metallophosphoesterase family protein [Candidatus Heimdallarchaeaceae archaeon]
MRVAVLADIHGSLRQLKRIKSKLEQVDLIFIAGDIAGTTSLRLIWKSILRSKRISKKEYMKLVFGDHYSSFAEFQLKTTSKIIDFLLKLDKPCFITHGNADTPEVIGFLKEIDAKNENFHYVENGIKRFHTYFVVGYGYCQPTEYNAVQTPGTKSLDEIAEDLEKFKGELSLFEKEEKYTLIGLFHEPPYDTKLDYIPNKNLHGGNKLIAEHISEIGYDYFFCGHVHESQGVELYNKTLIVNPGPMVNGQWAIVDLEKKEAKKEQFQPLFSMNNFIYKLRDIFN